MRHAPPGSFAVEYWPFAYLLPSRLFHKAWVASRPGHSDSCLCYDPTLTAQKNPSAWVLVTPLRQKPANESSDSVCTSSTA